MFNRVRKLTVLLDQNWANHLWFSCHEISKTISCLFDLHIKEIRCFLRRCTKIDVRNQINSCQLIILKLFTKVSWLLLSNRKTSFHYETYFIYVIFYLCYEKCMSYTTQTCGFFSIIESHFIFSIKNTSIEGAALTYSIWMVI